MQIVFNKISLNMNDISFLGGIYTHDKGKYSLFFRILDLLYPIKALINYFFKDQIDSYLKSKVEKLIAMLNGYSDCMKYFSIDHTKKEYDRLSKVLPFFIEMKEKADNIESGYEKEALIKIVDMYLDIYEQLGKYVNQDKEFIKEVLDAKESLAMGTVSHEELFND